MIGFALGLFIGSSVGVFCAVVLMGPKPKPLACQRCPENPDNYA